MKLLADQDVYASTIGFLRSLNHDVVTAAWLGLTQAEDAELLRMAGLLWGVPFVLATGWAIIKALDALCFAGRIRCPICDGSLWRCLKNGPRRRRVLLREEAVKCPSCGVDFCHRLEKEALDT